MESNDTQSIPFMNDLRGMSMREMGQAASSYPVYGRHAGNSGPTYMNQASLAVGTCKELDKYVRSTFYDGPTAYTLQKFTYQSQVAGDNTELNVVATYRQNHRHIGSLFEYKNGAAVRKLLNGDQQIAANGAYNGTIDATRAVNSQLRSGDRVVFSGIGVTDPRPETSRDGTYTMGYVPVTQADTNAHLLTSGSTSSHYGIFNMVGGTDKSPTNITEYALGGGRRAAASGVHEAWVWQPSVSISTEFNPQTANTSAAGALAIHLSGVSAADLKLPVFQLVVYALVGPRTDVGGYADTGYADSYPISCLRGLVNEQTSYIRIT